MNRKYLRSSLATNVTPGQRVALVQLMEECAELTVAASKTLRWGFASSNPDAPQLGTNDDQLASEFRDVVSAYERLRNDFCKV
jgi:hypothetical protein